MREIKFRAWNKKEKTIWRWDELLEPYDWEEVSYFDIEITLKEEESDFIFMQYTGLKDKNGKEIYEGDIDKEHGEINFCNKCHSYQFFYDLGDDKICHFCDGNFSLCEIDEIEIIGNIYENPNLLN